MQEKAYQIFALGLQHYHYLYCDEVQNFTHRVDFPTILAESRKYALSLTIGTQTLSQLPEASLAAVFGNCATFISFRVGGEDAHGPCPGIRCERRRPASGR
jgi:type IV secretory pathway TraG/TraD family ATPase VirD4